MIRFDVFKGGKRDAITLSYDDGREFDERLIGIFNKYGMKGTFHLPTAWFGRENNITHKYPDLSIYKGHEISCHGKNHLSVNGVSNITLCNEILEDRRELEKRAGYPVYGMSYANGRYSDEAIAVLKSCGIVYSRTTHKNERPFDLPHDFMKWHPTCHHRECLEYGKKFIDGIDKYRAGARILYVWGHSYEFNNDDNWDLIEEFCKIVSGRNDIWYATNMEIYEYIKAQRSLVISADEKMVYNPSSQEVWFTSDDEIMSVKAGETLIIK